MNDQGPLNAEVRASIAHRISGRFVGDDFSWLPGISAYGALLRTARLNHLHRGVFFAAFGLRTTRHDEISNVLTFSTTRKQSLALALGVNDKERALWDVSAWLPFSGNLDWESLPWGPRICPCCARLGYHTLLFQLPWIARCPWHGSLLIRHCRGCGRSLSLAWEVVPMRCACGIDSVNVREACRHRQSHLKDMALWVDNYLNWAATARSTSHLVHTSNTDASNWEALGQLIEMPASLRARCGNTEINSHHLHERNLSFPKEESPTCDATVLRLLLDVPVAIDGVIELPRPIWSAFRDVGYELAGKLPEAALSNGELLRFMDGSRRTTMPTATKNRADSSSILFLPVQIGGERGFLYVNAIAKAVRDVAHRLGRHLKDFEGPQGRVPYVGALILLRGYAEGMRVVLSRFVPALFEMKRDRPHLTVPWVLLKQKLDQTVQVKIVWAKRNDDCQAALTPKSRNNSRRQPA